MQINREYESEINLKSLVFHVLYRWRSILLVALIAAIALGSYQYYSVKSTHDAGKLTKDERQYQLDLQSYRENLEGARSRIATLSERLAGQKKYQEKSIYIRLDAQNVWTAQSKYLVVADQSVLDALPAGSTIDPADSILSSYATPLAGVSDEQMLKEAFSMNEAEYINELIYVETNTTNNTVTVRVKGSTREAAEKGLALLRQQMESLAAGKAQEVSAHRLMEFGEISFLGPDEGLAKKQADMIKTIADDQKALQQARADLDTLEAKEEPSEPGNHVKKMVAIGFVVGAILLAGLYCILYLLDGRLKDVGDLTEQYDLPVFGEFFRDGSLHKGRSLDKLLIKWERGKNETDGDTVCNRIASLIEEQGDANKILLLSTLPEERLASLQDALSNRLSQKTVEGKGNFLRNDEAVTEAAKADVVILVEGKDESRQEDIDIMAEALMIGKANVIGTIIL